MNALQKLLYDLRYWGYDDVMIARAVGTTQETICRIRNGKWPKSKHGLAIAMLRDKVAREQAAVAKAAA